MEFKHTETEDMKVTTVDDVSKERAKSYKQQIEALRKRGLVIELEDGIVFGLVGYETFLDSDGKPIIHIKRKEGMILYHRTEHPQCQKYLGMTMDWCERSGYEIRSARAECEKMNEIMKAEKLKNELKEGIHPEMTYVGKDGELDLD